MKIFLIGVALLASTVQAKTPDCRDIGSYYHCFNPPPATPMSMAERDAIMQRQVREETAILDTMRNQKTPALCKGAQDNARQKGRPDMVERLRKEC